MLMTNFNNTTLINGLKTKSESAFECAYKMFYDELFRFAVSYVMVEEIAHDIVHDTFLSLLENSAKISSNSNLKGYLYLTTKNKCINHLKHYHVMVHSTKALVETLLHSADVEYDFGLDDVQNKLNEVIKTLPPTQQTIIKMKVEGKNYEEISSELNISKLTVNVHIKRAYRKIRDTFIIISSFVLYLIFHFGCCICRIQNLL